jgi:hypothetical protein
MYFYQALTEPVHAETRAGRRPKADLNMYFYQALTEPVDAETRVGRRPPDILLITTF